MKYEVEQKFRCDDPAAISAKLPPQTDFWEAIEQVDRYFAHPSRNFAKTDEALRIRQVGNDCWVTYKGPKIDAETKTRLEIELPLSSQKGGLERFSELLIALGFKRVADVAKQRRRAKLRWEQSEFEVAFDDVAGLGSFVEIETSAEEADLNQARKRLQSLAAHLGLTDSIRKSYLELLLGE